jgi:hypothetical protein
MFLFVGHAYHAITKSSSFALEVLEQSFGPGDTLLINPDDSGAIEKLCVLNFSNYKFVVLWQLDYLAMAFTDVELHWKGLKKALLFNFSLYLHEIAGRVGCNTAFLKYAPQVPRNVSMERKGDKSVFFWERRPLSSLNFYSVLNLFEGRLEKIHVHQFPDSGQSTELTACIPGTTISYSTNFESSSDYLKLLDQFSYYVAPRLAEGIGFGFLEAMARGMVVIANDLPTHNEYIRNYRNGILFNLSRRDRIDLDSVDFKLISNEAIQTIQRINLNWQNYYVPLMIERIKSFVGSARRYKFYAKLSRVTLENLRYSHIDRKRYYSFLSLKSSNGWRSKFGLALLAERMGDLEQADRIFRTLEEKSQVGVFYEKMYALFRQRQRSLDIEIQDRRSGSIDSKAIKLNESEVDRR